MESNIKVTNPQNQYGYVYSTVPLTDTYMIHGFCPTGTSVVPVRVPVTVPVTVGFPSSVMIGQPLGVYRRVEPEMVLQGEPVSMTVLTPLQDGFEAALRRRSPPSNRIEEITSGYRTQEVNKDVVMLGKPMCATISGSKRKASSPSPSSSTVASSSAVCSKKIIEEWRCAVCDITATSEGGLKDHVAGKKHLTKVESLKSNNTGVCIGLGVRSSRRDNTGGETRVGMVKMVMNDVVQKQTAEMKGVCSRKLKMNDGGKMRKKFKFWCKTCKIGAYEEVVMTDHMKGKKHKKNRRVLLKARAQKRSYVGKSI